MEWETYEFLGWPVSTNSWNFAWEILECLRHLSGFRRSAPVPPPRPKEIRSANKGIFELLVSPLVFKPIRTGRLLRGGNVAFGRGFCPLDSHDRGEPFHQI